MRQLTSFTVLSEVVDGLHDCPFDLDAAQWDPTKRVWCARVLRPLWEAVPRNPWRVVIGTCRLPVVEGLLCLWGVKRVEVRDDQGIGTYTIDKMTEVTGGVILWPNERASIALDLADSVGGTYEERACQDIVARYSWFLLVQSGPRLEYLREARRSE